MKVDLNCSFLWLLGHLFLHIILLGLKDEIISSDGVVNTCSESCEDAGWESSHSLLCTGDSNDPARCAALDKFFKHANGETPHGHQ